MSKINGDNVMRNGYFQLVSDFGGYGLAVHQPEGGGEDIQLGELLDYLDGLGIFYDRRRIEMQIMGGMDGVCHLGEGECPVRPESYKLSVSDDNMTAYVRFIPPSETSERMSLEGFLKDLKYKNIVFGLQMESLRSHFATDGVYCTDILLAKGEEPTEGEDAKIEYCFNTDMHRRPAQREDGSVDFFHLTTINQCKQGDVLARMIPVKPGIPGYDIYGAEIKPRDVRKTYFKYGRNIELSEDELSLISKVDGHVSLVDEHVFVADIYTVEGVDVATGNLDYEGSIQVNGNVAENFEVKAGGNIIVNGLVEGARVIAGGSIIISKGMNGMQKGYLKAGGDIIVKFLENTRVDAGGYVETDAIMHSRVSAGTEIRVGGRRGLIVGGYVQAGTKIEARTIGAGMGASTIIEVGVNPMLRTQYNQMQSELEEVLKTVENAEVILNNFREKVSQGFKYNDSQLQYVRSIQKMVKEKRAELELMNQRMEKFGNMMGLQRFAAVVVEREIHPGTTIIIGDASRTLQSIFQYCRFVRERGEITLKPL